MLHLRHVKSLRDHVAPDNQQVITISLSLQDMETPNDMAWPDQNLLKDLGSEQDLVEQYGFKPDEAREAFRIIMIPPNQRTEADADTLKAFGSRVVEKGFEQLKAFKEKGNE